MQDAAAGRGDIFALSGFDHFDDLESFGTGISPDPAGREDCSGMRDFAAGFRGDWVIQDVTRETMTDGVRTEIGFSPIICGGYKMTLL